MEPKRACCFQFAQASQEYSKTKIMLSAGVLIVRVYNRSNRFHKKILAVVVSLGFSDGLGCPSNGLRR